MQLESSRFSSSEIKQEIYGQNYRGGGDGSDKADNEEKVFGTAAGFWLINGHFFGDRSCDLVGNIGRLFRKFVGVCGLSFVFVAFKNSGWPPWCVPLRRAKDGFRHRPIEIGHTDTIGSFIDQFWFVAHRFSENKPLIFEYPKRPNA